MDMGATSLARAHALSVSTRKRLREPTIEDPMLAMDRILTAVRRKSYAEARAYLHAEGGLEAPRRVRGKPQGDGSGLIFASVLTASDWLVSVPLLAAGLMKNLALPHDDEAANRPLHRELVTRLEALKRGVAEEIEADKKAARWRMEQPEDAKRIAATPVDSTTVHKEWTSVYSAPAISCRPVRGGWVPDRRGELHVGDAQVAFFGVDGRDLEIPLDRVGRIMVACSSVVTLQSGRRRRDLGFLVIPGAHECAALLSLSARRAKQEKAVRQRPRNPLRPGNARRSAEASGKRSDPDS